MAAVSATTNWKFSMRKAGVTACAKRTGSSAITHLVIGDRYIFLSRNERKELSCTLNAVVLKLRVHVVTDVRQRRDIRWAYRQRQAFVHTCGALQLCDQGRQWMPLFYWQILRQRAKWRSISRNSQQDNLNSKCNLCLGTIGMQCGLCALHNCL